MTASSVEKIAFFIPTLSGGGVERMFTNMAIQYVKWGYSVDMVLCKKEGVYLNDLPNEIRVFELKSFHVIPLAIKFRKYLKINRPDFVISALEYNNAAAILANKLIRNRTRILVSVRCNISGMIDRLPLVNKLYIKFLVRFFYPQAHVIVAISKGVSKDLSALSKIALSKINVVYNPAFNENMLSLAEDNSQLPSWFNNQKGPVLCAIGRLIEQKDFIMLLEAFRLLYLKNSSFRLIILGEGTENKILHHFIDTNGLTDVVRILPFTKNPFVFIKRSDLFVLSSKYEGFGNVIVEALACGVQVVSTDCPSGPAEILQDGKFGFLTPVGDSKSMANTILFALNHPIEKEKLIQRAKDFDVKIIAKKYLDLLKKSTSESYESVIN